MISDNIRMTTIQVIIVLAILILIPQVSADLTSPENNDPVYIGVLLPLTGPDGLPLYQGLRMGIEQINAGGGINGRLLYPVYRDTRTGDIRIYAKELAFDPRIDVVIGPYTSEELFTISDIFIRNQKILVSPSASSDEVFRAFAGTGNVWRLRTSSRDIISVVMQHLSAHNARSVAILAKNNTYGNPYGDWIPFYGIETGIQVTGSLEYSTTKELTTAIRELSAQNPDYIIFASSGSNQDIITALKTLETEDTPTQLYLIQPNINENGYIQEKSDSETLLKALVSGQWKLASSSTISAPLPDNTLMIASPPPEPSFSTEYRDFSGQEPPLFVSEVYDALLVSSLILAAYHENPRQSPMKAAKSLFMNTTGVETSRTTEGFQAAFDLVKKGSIPVLTGATGPLTFVSEGTDRKIPWFQTYRIQNGELIEDPIPYEDIEKQDIHSDRAIRVPVTESSITGSNMSSEAHDYWAVLAGMTRDWNNYRHQADTLTMYQVLREQGVPDDHIILLIYDDIPTDPQNRKPGEVYHIPGIQEVRKTATPDYDQEEVLKRTLRDVLTGGGQYQDNPVLGSDENSTILLYIASHGIRGGEILITDGKEKINGGELSSIIEEMKKKKMFGRMLVVLESCFSGATGEAITTPGVLVMTAASSNETSKSDIYDAELSVWISDEFTNKLISTLNESGEKESIRTLFEKVYHAVRSSHPSVYNYNNSFSLDTPAITFFGGDYRSR